jgi:hypothetical protein
MLRDILYFTAIAWVIVGCAVGAIWVPERAPWLLLLLLAAVAGGCLRARRIMGEVEAGVRQ